MKADTIIHSFSRRSLARATRMAVLFLLWISTAPAAAQVYSTAQRGTQYEISTSNPYGATYSGTYSSQEAQYNYNPYQSNVYKPGSSAPSTSLRGRRLSTYNPWADSYAPMGSKKKNAPVGGGDYPAVGEDKEGPNDPEGETGAPDGFITPSDPGHQSNQSPVGEAWVMIFFAAIATAVIYFRRRKFAAENI